MRRACAQAIESCPYAETKPGCYSDTHHLYYPRANYRTQLEKQFRELAVNKEQLCRYEHDQVHAENEPPLKPTREQMLGALAMEGEVA